jgi:hypothetical protein
MVLLIYSTNKFNSFSLPSNLIGLIIAKSCYIVLTFILSKIRISYIVALDSIVTAEVFFLLDTINILRVIIYYSFTKVKQVCFKLLRSFHKIRYT